MNKPKALLNQRLMLSIACLNIAACANYEVSVNERTVYTPQPLFTDFRVADHRLQTCLDQTIKDAKITRASQLESLNCSHAGIQVLTGLTLFSEIKYLNLADNQIQETADLAMLGKLEQVVLRNNQLTRLPEALTWLAVEDIDVAGNPNLACEDLIQVQKNQTVNIKLPEHCQQR